MGEQDVGPLFEVPTRDGGRAPFYPVHVDKAGALEGPRTVRHLLDAVESGDHTDVYVFSHGWNNDYDTALARYRGFIEQFGTVRETYGVELGREHRPLLAGVFWPSTALVWPWEEGPTPAAGGALDPAAQEAVDVLDESVADADRQRFHELVTQPTLARKDGATELAGLLAGALPGDVDLGDDAATVDDLLATWTALDTELAAGAGGDIAADPFDFSVEEDADPAGPGEAQAAGLLDKLNPRNLVRMLTVRQMKDRAGTVGTGGVGELLRGVQEADEDVRVHVIGHSYGARVVLNAVSRPRGGPLPRPVTSMLLLQPALNHLCFSASLPGHPSTPGGYREALEQVQLPLLSTYSPHDFPLTKVFHLALCRAKDLGDISVAAAGEPPNKYAALGGFGPRGDVSWRRTTTLLPSGSEPEPEDFYDLTTGAPAVWALDGTDSIDSHGAVVNPTTAWALWNLVKAS